MITPIHASSARLAWSSKRQSAFGTPLLEEDLDRFLKLQSPLIIDETASHWSDTGMVGSGHHWTEQRGRERQSVTIGIPDQPLPVDFIGYLLGLVFSAESAQTTAGGANQHSCSFQPLDNRPEAWTTSLAVSEDGQNHLIQDIAVSDVKLSGAQDARLRAGANLLASKIGGSVSGGSWPESSPLRYLYSYAGAFSIDGDSTRRAQLRSFDFQISSGINAELAWQKAADESGRIYPSWWPYTPERKIELSFALIGTSGDLAVFRAAQQNATPMEVVISCLGETISGTSPPENDMLEITVPNAVFTTMSYSYDNGMMVINLTAEGNYHAATGGPVSLRTVEGQVSEYFA